MCRNIFLAVDELDGTRFREGAGGGVVALVDCE
jgi:hypothetical protein